MPRFSRRRSAPRARCHVITDPFFFFLRLSLSLSLSATLSIVRMDRASRFATLRWDHEGPATTFGKFPLQACRGTANRMTNTFGPLDGTCTESYGNARFPRMLIGPSIFQPTAIETEREIESEVITIPIAVRIIILSGLAAVTKRPFASRDEIGSRERSALARRDTPPTKAARRQGTGPPSISPNHFPPE